MNEVSTKLLNKLIFGKYKIIKKEAKGAYSVVYSGKDIKNNKNVAIKIQKKTEYISSLENEAYFLYNLKGFGIPKIISYGTSGKYNILIEELLGKSLEVLFKENKNKSNEYRLKDMAIAGIQIIDRIKFIHDKYILHLDIKPNNFLVGIQDTSVIYIIDFGFAKKYRSSRTGKHIHYSKSSYFNGNLVFSSVYTMKGIESSRRDDLESLGYMLIYLYTQQLPWSNLKSSNNLDLTKKIYELKQNIKMKILCKDLPIEMNEYMKYVKSLKFEENPNYNYLTKLFEIMLEKMSRINDMNFSWVNNSLINCCSKRIQKRRSSHFIKIFKLINTKSICEEKKNRTYSVNNNYKIFSFQKEKLNIPIEDNKTIKMSENKELTINEYNPNNNKKIKIIKYNNCIRDKKSNKYKIIKINSLNSSIDNKNIKYRNNLSKTHTNNNNNTIFNTKLKQQSIFRSKNTSYKLFINPIINDESKKFLSGELNRIDINYNKNNSENNIKYKYLNKLNQSKNNKLYSFNNKTNIQFSNLTNQNEENTYQQINKYNLEKKLIPDIFYRRKFKD